MIIAIYNSVTKITKLDYKNEVMFIVDLFGVSLFKVAGKIADENENINVLLIKRSIR